MSGKATGNIGRFKPEVGLEVAKSILSVLACTDLVERASVAGSLRRKKEVIGDVDLLVVPEGGEHTLDTADAICRAVTSLLERVGKDGNLPYGLAPWIMVRKGVFKPKTGWSFGYPAEGKRIQVDLLVSTRACFESNLLFFTGSKKLNIEMRSRAQGNGWKLSNYGLFDSQGIVLASTERDIFEKLDMKYLEPKDR